MGTSHRFVGTNQNAKAVVALDNIIQSPLVSTAVTTTLADQVFDTTNVVEFLANLDSPSVWKFTSMN